MRRQVLYSGSRPPHSKQGPNGAATDVPEALVHDHPPRAPSVLRRALARYSAALRFLAGAACAALIAWYVVGSRPEPQRLTQENIDAAVLHTLENKALPSRAAKAAE